MGQALYRKYRSKSLSEIVGQEHITKTLAQAIKSGKISHAYLLTGPRGVGKTSIARILAHEINGLPYDGQSHLDIIEIDAASNNGVEDVRDLREKVYVAPTSSKYKVYIIDEVHMLSKAAFNALLKTLEEPPAHAVFILATTESHKLPATIISRTQRYIFRPIDEAAAVKHLRTIAKAEGMDFTDEALTLIAKHGEGSFRDSISLLDQLGTGAATVGAEDVLAALGIAPDTVIANLLAAIEQGTTVSDCLTQLNSLYEAGYQPTAIAKQLGIALRERIIQGSNVLPLDAASQILAELLRVPSSHDPERFLEITLLRALPVSRQAAAAPVAAPVATPVAQMPKAAAPKTTAAAAPVTPPEPKATAKPIPKPVAEAAKPEPPAPATTEAPVATAPTVEATAGQPLDDNSWQAILNTLKQKYNTLYSIARMAKARFVDENTLELSFSFAFHQKRISEAKNRQIVSDAIMQIIGRPVELICTLNPDLKLSAKDSTAELPPIPGATKHGEALSTISNIFGGAELLES